MHNLTKKFQYSFKNYFNILFLNNNVYLGYNNKTFIKLHTNNFVLFLTNNTMYGLYEHNNFTNQKFIYIIELFLKKNIYPYTKKLIFKGLGLKSSIKDNILELKLGYSNIIRIEIPVNKIYIKIFKNNLIISSNNLSYLGAFVYKIKKLKMPNIYKGKGIWYKHEKLKLKPINK